MKNYVTGAAFTYSKLAAAAARFTLFDYLDHKHFDFEAYVQYGYDDKEYNFEFENLPIEIWNKFAKVWIGVNAIYTYGVGCCVCKHDETRKTKDDCLAQASIE